METIAYLHIVDREGWPSGPWDKEPDKVQWQDEETKLPCLAVRNRLGAWCGYVGVAKGHPYFEMGYEEAGRDLDVHYGLTFSDLCHPHPDEHGICHIPGEGEPDHVWWLGFDCAHGTDVVPGMLKFEKIYPASMPLVGKYGETYKDLNYVKEEVKGLARQLASVEGA